MFPSDTVIPDAELAMLPARELGELVRGLERQRRQTEATLARVVAIAEQVEAHRADAHAGISGWLRAVTKCSTADATGVVRLAQTWRHHPAVIEALDSGDIGVGHAREIARLAAHPRCGAELGGHLTELLQHAEQVGFDEFRLLTRRWEMLADADGPNPDPSAGRDARNASFDEVGDGYVLRAGCDRASGVELGHILARYVEEELRLDLVATGGAPGVPLPRTPTQRRFDALERIFRDAVAVGPGATDPEPLVNLVIDIGTLERMINDDAATARQSEEVETFFAPGSDSFDHAPPGSNSDEARRSRPTDPARALRNLRSETIDGCLTDPMDVVKAMLWGRVRWVVTNRLGEITAYSSKQRLFTGARREIVLLHAQRCIWPGCAIRGSRCQADHLHDHQHGGTTSLDNGAPLCRKHNDHKSRNGYRIARDSDGYWHTHRPDGTEL